MTVENIGRAVRLARVVVLDAVAATLWIVGLRSQARRIDRITNWGEDEQVR